MSDLYKLCTTLAAAGASMGEIIKASHDDSGVIYLDRVREGRSSAERSGEEEIERDIMLILMGWLCRGILEQADERGREFAAAFTQDQDRPPSDEESKEASLTHAHELTGIVAERFADFIAAFQSRFGLPAALRWTRTLTLHLKYPEEDVQVQPVDHPQGGANS